MAESKRHISRRNKVKGRVQFIYNEPQKEFVERYLTPKGKWLVKQKLLTTKQADKLYGKNRYKKSEYAFIIKSVYHDYPF